MSDEPEEDSPEEKRARQALARAYQYILSLSKPEKPSEDDPEGDKPEDKEVE